jgi:hypothetical protein
MQEVLLNVYRRPRGQILHSAPLTATQVCSSVHVSGLQDVAHVSDMMSLIPRIEDSFISDIN